MCNPMDLSYRFNPDAPSRREAADPTMIRFKDEFYLFASKSSGYWHSSDLSNWTFIETYEIPVEEYAPTVIALGDTLYFLASSNEKSTIYKSGNPLDGKWTVAREELETPVWDPAFLLDDDQRLYLYWGCSNVNPLMGVELDYKNNFSFIGEPKALVHARPNELGWEVPGDYNRLTKQSPWIEGPWLNKHNGRYYLQYAGPGTEFKSYSDAVYVGENPLGPYTLQQHNPMAYKPEGFAAGAGHGSTFGDEYGNLWHIGTVTISQKHMFERRLAIFPTFFDDKGVLYSSTKYGDYPMIIPTGKIKSTDEIFPGWMLLSYKKSVSVSSSIDSFPATNASDDDIRTYWAAQSGNEGEFLTMDLGSVKDVYAIQINFAEHEAGIFSRKKGIAHRYKVESSTDGKEWQVLTDKSDNTTDNSHVYFQLTKPVESQYIKVTNLQVPGGHFAMSDLRVFGKGRGEVPAKPQGLTAERDSADRRTVVLSWDKVENATGYNVSFGVTEKGLYSNYIVYADNSVTINTLNKGEKYYFTVEAFNENGITQGEQIVSVD